MPILQQKSESRRPKWWKDDQSKICVQKVPRSVKDIQNALREQKGKKRTGKHLAHLISDLAGPHVRLAFGYKKIKRKSLANDYKTWVVLTAKTIKQNDLVDTRGPFHRILAIQYASIEFIISSESIWTGLEASVMQKDYDPTDLVLEAVEASWRRALPLHFKSIRDHGRMIQKQLYAKHCVHPIATQTAINLLLDQRIVSIDIHPKSRLKGLRIVKKI